MLSWLMVIGFGVATFSSLFLYMAIGMAIGEFQANVFLVSILVAAAGIAATICWWPQKKEP
jgi:hypothetical protein